MNALIMIALSIFLLYAPAGTADTPDDAIEVPSDAAETPADAPETPPDTAEPPIDVPGSPSSATEPPTGIPASSPGATEPPAGASGTPGGTTTDFAAVKNYLVIVKDGIDADVHKAPGFSISDHGYILTHSDMLRDRSSYLVQNPSGQVFAASKIKKDEKTGLLLLRVAKNGHGLTALKFARTVLQPAAPLYAVDFNPDGPAYFTSVAGTVTRLPATDDEYPLIIHNALFNLTSAGTPLLNRCYEAVGVNILQKQRFWQKQIDPAEQGHAGSLSPFYLDGFLASVNLSLPVMETECLSLEEETRQKLEQTRKQKEAALQAADKAKAAAEEAQRRFEQAQQEKEAALQAEREAAADKAKAAAEEAKAAAEEAKAAAEEAQRRFEQAQQEKETALKAAEAARQAEKREQQIRIYSSIAGGALLLAAILMMYARRKRLHSVEQEKEEIAGALGRAQSELSDAAERDRLRIHAPDVFIEGITPQRERVALKIPGASLVDPSGAIVGRSPAESTFIINHEQVSRRHFRLFLVAQQIMIEDMGSTNGTSVNGIRVAQGVRQPLANGGHLRLGNLEFTVRIGT